MIDWKILVKKGGGFAGLAFLLSACVGAGEPTSLPTPETVVLDDIGASDSHDAQSTRIPADKYANLEIVTLLPRDAIPAIDNPQFLSTEEAEEFYGPDELVLGVSFDGDTRAYSVPFLSNHEIVNDTVGGEKIAVTW